MATVTNVHEARTREGRYADAARTLHILGSPIRLQIIDMLRDGSLPVRDMVNALGVTQPLVSQHLKVLKDANFVTSERNGRLNIYSLSSNALVNLIDTTIEINGA